MRARTTTRLRLLPFLRALAVIAATATPVLAADVSGSAVVVDGDTLRIGSERIRLHGIDAPEARQQCKDAEGRAYSCSAKASAYLVSLIGTQEVQCKGIERDRYRRLVAVCKVGETNINEAMVRSGWALAYRQYSKDYVSAEDSARTRKAGVWDGSFVEPFVWRRTGRN